MNLDRFGMDSITLAGPLEGKLGAIQGAGFSQAMLTMCRALGADVLLACSSTSGHASADPADLVRDLRKLTTLAVPLGIRISLQFRGVQRRLPSASRRHGGGARAALDAVDLGTGVAAQPAGAAEDRSKAGEVSDSRNAPHPRRAASASISCASSVSASSARQNTP
jgi:hypothetical protein